MKLLFVLCFFLLIPLVYADSTFFDQDDSFIMGGANIPSDVTPSPIAVGGGAGGITIRKPSMDLEETIITESIQVFGGNLYSINDLNTGELELELLDNTLSLTKIFLGVAREAIDVNLIIGESRNTRLKKPYYDVYRYFNLESNIPNSFFSKIRIIFKVNKNWGEDIKLLRYHEKYSEWKELETKKINEDVYYKYYESRSEDFSEFAVVNKEIKPKFEEVTSEISKDIDSIILKPSKKTTLISGVTLLIGAMIVLIITKLYASRLKRKRINKRKKKTSLKKYKRYKRKLKRKRKRINRKNHKKKRK